jgi:predicted  nucleic acid-binding Zn-ribbon protein
MTHAERIVKLEKDLAAANAEHNDLSTRLEAAEKAVADTSLSDRVKAIEVDLTDPA